MTRKAHTMLQDQDVLERRDERLEAMNFLNQISDDYPDAISFASGRPAESFFDLGRWIERVPAFAERHGSRAGLSVRHGFDSLAQYGRTNGLINDLISRQLMIDEGIRCAAEHIVVTAGCQEALDLLVPILCPSAGDVILACSPSYIGITGVAARHKTELLPFSRHGGRSIVASLTQTIEHARTHGKQARVLYLVPDFDNPTGAVLSLDERTSIIELCAEMGIIILEDNPYGMFCFEGTRLPTMFSLDRYGCVIYLGTYSKTICPALRVGFAALPPALCHADSNLSVLGKLSRAKSFVSVNTSQLAQAVVGALLLDAGCSLTRHVSPATGHYRGNRDCMLASLSSTFAYCGDQVSWNEPKGGFFLIVDLPFSFLRAQAMACARDHGVLVMPLSFFAFDDEHDNRIRLAFSNVTHDAIRDGVARLGRFVQTQLAAR